MPTYADLSGRAISIIAGRFEMIADTLTAGAYIDQKLKTLLLANFFDSPKARDFVDVNQPLGTFSARIDPARIPAPDREGHFCAEPPMCLS
jgi:hypothetical protein